LGFREKLEFLFGERIPTIATAIVRSFSRRKLMTVLTFLTITCIVAAMVISVSVTQSLYAKPESMQTPPGPYGISLRIMNCKIYEFPMTAYNEVKNWFISNGYGDFIIGARIIPGGDRRIAETRYTFMESSVQYVTPVIVINATAEDRIFNISYHLGDWITDNPSDIMISEVIASDLGVSEGSLIRIMYGEKNVYSFRVKAIFDIDQMENLMDTVRGYTKTGNEWTLYPWIGKYVLSIGGEEYPLAQTTAIFTYQALKTMLEETNQKLIMGEIIIDIVPQNSILKEDLFTIAEELVEHMQQLAKKWSLNMEIRVNYSTEESCEQIRWEISPRIQLKGLPLLVTFGAIAVMMIGNTMYGVLEQRQKEVKIWTAVGANPSDVSRNVSIEALIYAFVGLGCGVLLGLALQALSNLPAISAVIPPLPQTLTGEVLAIIVISTIFFCWLGALLPARKASIIAVPSLKRTWKPKGKEALKFRVEEQEQPVLLSIDEVESLYRYITSRKGMDMPSFYDIHDFWGVKAKTEPDGTIIKEFGFKCALATMPGSFADIKVKVVKKPEWELAKLYLTVTPYTIYSEFGVGGASADTLGKVALDAVEGFRDTIIRWRLEGRKIVVKRKKLKKVKRIKLREEEEEE